MQHALKMNTLHPRLTTFHQQSRPHQGAHPDSATLSTIPTDSNLAFQVSVWHQGGRAAGWHCWQFVGVFGVGGCICIQAVSQAAKHLLIWFSRIYNFLYTVTLLQWAPLYVFWHWDCFDKLIQCYAGMLPLTWIFSFFQKCCLGLSNSNSIN